MENLAKRLEKRGWSKKEISKSIEIIHNTKQFKPERIKFLEKKIFLVLLMLIIAGNFAIAVALIPILLVVRGLALYLILAVMGLFFGLLFELVIRSIEYFERKHHIILVILIPIISLAIVYVISKTSNSFTKSLNLNNFHDPVIVALVYAVSFVMPYLVYRFILKRGYYAEE